MNTARRCDARAFQTVVEQNEGGRGENERRRREGCESRSGYKLEDGVSKTGEVMTRRAGLRPHINQRFVGEKLFKDSNISVDTSKHVVTLKGTVTGSAGRARAAAAARRTEGVHRVVNQQTINRKHTD